ncbi:MscL family protein [Candidatus Saccharibacteria bacterium]|nr:MAG: MscL family protein [Candidatus Saccharibacteria bacterium]
MGKTSNVKGFADFVREQGVVGLAVGLAIGVAAGTAVKEIVDQFINPLVGYILGGADLAKLKWNTGLSRGGEDLVFGWGAILGAIITLLATAFVVYQLVHLAKLDRIDKKKD